ncbi:HTH-type transcriptional repressor PurR [Streptomyces hirsutus]
MLVGGDALAVLVRAHPYPVQLGGLLLQGHPGEQVVDTGCGGQGGVTPGRGGHEAPVGWTAGPSRKGSRRGDRGEAGSAVGSYECFGLYVECSGNLWRKEYFVKGSRRDTIAAMTSSQPAETRTRGRSAQTATLAEIAREAGVWALTVSKVLNGRADVAPATRRRVEELLRAHGYRRRRAEATRSPLLDLVFHELESAWAMEVIRGVENVARDAGLSVVLSESAGRLTPGRTWADQVAARRPHGVILVLSGLDESGRALLTSRSIPFVVMDPAGDPGTDVPSIGATNWQGGLAATRHLVELGVPGSGRSAGPRR